jgi:hypothetical protein
LNRYDCSVLSLGQCNETARFHQTHWWGSSLANCGARAAGKTSYHRMSGHIHTFRVPETLLSRADEVIE